jgi:hypothetical protein
LRPLDNVQRKNVLFLSATLCAAPLILAPIAGRPSFQDVAKDAATDTRLDLPSLPLAWTPAPVVLKRDPFASAASASSTVASAVTARPDIVEVRAIVTGTTPRALVESAGILRIVSAGASLQGSVVVRIDAAGIHLKNGAMLALPGAKL